MISLIDDFFYICSSCNLNEMAEFGWGISEELLKKSEKELGEDQFKRSEDIADVREQIETRPDISRTF